MKKLLILVFAFSVYGCATLSGTYNYIPTGPQGLTRTVEDYKKMPVYVSREDIKKPWSAIGLIRIKNLPNNRETINREIDRMKSDAAKKGADAIIINQYFDENNQSYPVILAGYLVKFAETLTEEDLIKVNEFAQQASIENAKS